MNDSIFIQASIKDVPLDASDEEIITMGSAEAVIRECIKETLSLIDEYLDD